MSGMTIVALQAVQAALTARGWAGPGGGAASADLDPGQRRVRPCTPADGITVAEWVLSHQRAAVEGEPVPAQVSDPPLAVGERKPGMLPGHRRYLGKPEFDGPPAGAGAGHPGFRYRVARDQPQYRDRAADSFHDCRHAGDDRPVLLLL